MTARYIVGSAIHELRAMPAESVDLVVTSPPFLGQRDYLDPDDPAKHLEHGRTSTPAEFVGELLDTVDACHRVLAPHGSLVIELGDSYSGSGGAGGDYYNADGLRAGQPKPPGAAKLARHQADAWPLPKSLALIPEMLRLAMGYGEQPYTGRETSRWLIRNVIAWCKPNPSVGSEGDKYRRGWNPMLVAAKTADRWWDPLAARGPSRTEPGKTAPMLDWWEQPTGSYAGAHFATFPLDLVKPLVAAMCPPKVCTTCGQPSNRVVRRTEAYEAARGGGDIYGNGDGNDRGTGRNGGWESLGGKKRTGLVAAEYEHVGWTACGHDTWRRGVVLDPYAGTGSTLAAAVGSARDAIGVDLDARNADMAIDRVGPMFINIEKGNAHVT